ncbi:hypothetical protein PCASD_05475 [Puccinia coronata f. sp. avenae]|uniref:Uracil-DNA glycosylase-like domain-containing protein n=1 Tax=Puccinia coronata f. sp. avenae TaxID=200324 RepID=A0A2N5V8T7_9BASI|nr:hypothetical protein PCASD_05475 [Puccinia coronata f. sp. avenae]
MFITQIPSWPGQSRIKRRRSQLDLDNGYRHHHHQQHHNNNNNHHVHDDESKGDDEMGSSPTLHKTQLSLDDIWGCQRSDGVGAQAGHHKRPRLASTKNQREDDDEKLNNNNNNNNNNNMTNKSASINHTVTTHSRKYLNPSSSLASRSPSNSSLFSIQSISLLSSKSDDISDGIDEWEFEFQPAVFPLELDPLYGIHPTWLEALRPVLIQPEIISLHQQLGTKNLGYEYKLGEKPDHLQSEISPRYHDLYNWTRLTPLDKVKVVILGYAPLPHPYLAHGLAFSQPTSCAHVSGSIQSIHRELASQYPDEFKRPGHGSLVSWARAGVLLLNIIQTAPRDDPTAHAKYGWSEYATRVLEIVSRDGGSFYAPKKHPNPIAAPPLSSSDTKGLVFLAWGPHAIQHIRSAGILNSHRRHKVLTAPGSPHPSSASTDGFFNHQHFLLANQYLREAYGEQHLVDWCRLDAVDPSYP